MAVISTPQNSVRGRDRQAVRQVIRAAGFEHAIDSVVQPMVVELAGRVTDEERLARVLEAAVLDSMVHVARALGWGTP